MPFTLTMPKLSPTMEEGTMVSWKKKEGDKVVAGDLLFEVATDKATVEHHALDPGYLRQILVKEGQRAIVNQPIAIFTVKSDESIAGYQPEGAVPQLAPEAPAVESVSLQEPTSKTPCRAPAAKGDQPLFAPEPPLKNYLFSGPGSEGVERVNASPLAKKMASEQNVDLTTVRGSGPHGRIVAKDVPLAQPSGAVTFGRRALPSEVPGSYIEEALTPMRKVIGQRLQESKSYIPHFYVNQEVNMDSLVQVRAELAAAGLKFSFNDFVLRATALALREHPVINSGFHSGNQTIIRFKTVDISVAVSIPSGLITPIVRHADFKHIGQLSQEVRQLAMRAREGRLSREEYTGGSFTISNLGMYGISSFAAIINPPQAAILAVGGIEEKPVVKGGVVVPGKVLNLTLSADHRVVDGSDAAAFLKTIQKYLQSPSLLLVS